MTYQTSKVFDAVSSLLVRAQIRAGTNRATVACEEGLALKKRRNHVG